MFTGIVQAIGTILEIRPQPAGIRLVVDRSSWSPPGGYTPAHGDSICCSGCCLTVVETTDKTLSFDVITQSLNVTKLGSLQAGDAINLEPAVLPSQPLGGHFMQGHVDGLGTVTGIHEDESDWRITIEPEIELMKFMSPKGSIAIDGVSLTLADLTDSTITVALIPTTLKLTTLESLKVGHKVNLEADVITKTVVHQLKQMGVGGKPIVGEEITMQKLEDAGFTDS